MALLFNNIRRQGCDIQDNSGGEEGNFEESQFIPRIQAPDDEIPRQRKNVLDAFLRLLGGADEGMLARIAGHAAACAGDAQPSVKKVARRIQREMERTLNT